ncbi:MAG: hemolysin family protein [Chloroflexia bacterium]
MLAGLAAILVLVAATGFFVASEFALVSVRKTRIEQLITEGNSNAAQVKRAIDKLPIYIAATQAGITMATLGLGALGEPVLAQIFVPPLEAVLPEEFVKTFVSAHGIAIAISFLIVTVLEIILGEFVPKIIARQRSESTALFIIRPLNFFLFIFRPLVWIINTLGNAMLRLLGMTPDLEHASVHSVEELEMLVASSRQAGVLEEEEEAILRRVFDLGDLTARQVMLPRTEMNAVPVEASFHDVMHIIEQDRHSRYPVYEGNLDYILGVLYVKDVFLVIAREVDEHLRDGPATTPAQFSVRALMRDILTVPESMDVNHLLARMKQSRIHIAVVIDEYGGTAGIVTLEDVVEEIVGEVRDEFEVGEEKPDIEFTPDGTLVNGLTAIDDLNERLGLSIESEADTVGGYVFELLGRKPELGDEVSVDGHLMRVEGLDGLRIAQVKILPKPKATAPAVPDEESI